ncbi:MAG: hypothetical protein KF911_01780 [Pseudomonadales bacterium]|nr:hypothetical protein [Pseudomonadales bacterium]
MAHSSTGALANLADFPLGGLGVRPSTREVICAAETLLLEPRVMQCWPHWHDAAAPSFAPAWAELAMRRVVCLRRSDRDRFPGLTAAAAETAAAPHNPEVLNLAGQFLAEVGRLAEALALWDQALANWPEVEALAAEAIADAANAGAWARLDRLIDTSRRHGHVNARFLAFAAAQQGRRAPHPEMLQAHRDRMAVRFARDRRVALADLAQLHAMGATDEAFDYVERASFAHLFEAGAPMRAGVWAPAVIFVAANRALIADRRFVRLCARLGLVAYWVETDRWPDCADVPGLNYDFRAECRLQRTLT